MTLLIAMNKMTMIVKRTGPRRESKRERNL